MEITSKIVRLLIRQQLLQWEKPPEPEVAEQGNDNRTYRLGDKLAVRLPSTAQYVDGVAKEDHCLPLLARHLSTAVPTPFATGGPGGPGADYSYPWVSAQMDNRDHTGLRPRTRPHSLRLAPHSYSLLDDGIPLMWKSSRPAAPLGNGRPS